MIGAGGQAGQGDAANLLKPALARGELRTIAATTWAEYKKYFEKDAALERRFQVVKVEEPDEDRAIRMMRGITATLEKHHEVAHPRRGRRGRRQAVAPLHPGPAAPGQVGQPAGYRLRPRGARARTATPPAVEDCRREIDHLQARARHPRPRGGDRRRPRRAAGGADGSDGQGARRDWRRWRSSGRRSASWSRQIREAARSCESRPATPRRRQARRRPATAGRRPRRQRAGRDCRSSWRKLQGETPLVQPVGRPPDHRRGGRPAGPASRSARCCATRSRRCSTLQDEAGGARHRPAARAGGDRPAHPDGPRQPDRPAPADRRVPAGRAQRRRQDRDRPGPGRHPLRRRAQPDHRSTCPSTRRRTRSRA